MQEDNSDITKWKDVIFYFSLIEETHLKQGMVPKLLQCSEKETSNAL